MPSVRRNNWRWLDVRLVPLKTGKEGELKLILAAIFVLMPVAQAYSSPSGNKNALKSQRAQVDDKGACFYQKSATIACDEMTEAQCKKLNNSSWSRNASCP